LLRVAGVEPQSTDAAADVVLGLDATELAGPRRKAAAHLDAIAKELSVSISYANHRYAGVGVSKVLLIGGGAAVPGAAAVLRRSVQAELKIVTPSIVAECPAGAVDAALTAAPALLTAIGLAQSEQDAPPVGGVS